MKIKRLYSLINFDCYFSDSTLQEELAAAEEEQNAAVKLHRIARDKLQRSQAQLSEVSSQVTKLKVMRQKKLTRIESIKDQIDADVPDNTTELVCYKVRN